MRYAPIASLFGCMLVFGSARAATTTLQATDNGQYDLAGDPDDTGDYIVGRDNAGATELTRSFFVFDLATVSGVVGAELRLFNPTGVTNFGGYQSPDSQETIGVFDVSTAIASLEGDVSGAGIYTDLGTGTLLGQTNVSSSDNGQYVSIVLSNDAVTAINAASGGKWAVGVSMTTQNQSAGTFEYVFGFTGNPPAEWRQLVLTTPEPTGPTSIVLAFLAAFAARRRGGPRR